MAHREQHHGREKKKPKKSKEQKKAAATPAFSTQPSFAQPQNNANQWQKGKK
jgi:hypothetical protein